MISKEEYLSFVENVFWKELYKEFQSVQEGFKDELAEINFSGDPESRYRAADIKGKMSMLDTINDAIENIKREVEE